MLASPTSLSMCLVSCLVISALGCTRSDSSGKPEAAEGDARPNATTPAGEDAPASGDANAAANAALKALSEATGDGKKAVSVDHRKLKALLPETLPGMKRSSAKSEKTGAVGFTVSFAEAEYDGEAGAGGDSKHVQIRMTDMSGTGGLQGIAAGWAMAEIDSESDDGHEKTTTYSGHKAIERYTKSSKHGEIQVLAGSRIMVEVSGNGVAMDDLKAALGKIDLGKVAAAQ